MKLAIAAIAAFTAVLMLTGAARAAGPSPADQAAITAIESRVGRTAAAGETQTYKTLAERMAELKVPPSPYTAQSKVTLRRLLSPTAGMTVSGFPGYAAGTPVPTLVQVLNGTPPSNTPAIQSYEAPGGLYAYSGGGFMIALQAAYAGRPHAILSQASARTMLTPVDAAAGYGLGEVLGRRGGHPYFTHSGGNEGFQCDSFAFLDGSEQGVVMMTNSDSGGIIGNEIIRALAEAYHWGDPDPANGKSNRRAPDKPPAAK